MGAVQLSEEIGMYVDKLRAEFPAIDEVWLLGERVNDPGARASWELLVFADRETLEALRSKPEWRRSDVNLSVVANGDRYRAAWGDAPEGRLGDLDWRRSDPQTATYRGGGNGGSEPSRLDAVRVR